MLGANYSGGVGPSGLSGGKKIASKVLVVEADKDNWVLNGMITAAEAGRSGLRGKFNELQTECWAMHAEVSAGLDKVL